MFKKKSQGEQISKFLFAVLYHCMFKYVLFFSSGETLKQGRNVSR